ncbi:type III helper protein HopAK1, partial [Pseudomonas syringae]
KYKEDDTARTVQLTANLPAYRKETINYGSNKSLLRKDMDNSQHKIYLASGNTPSNDLFQNLNFDHDSRYRETGEMQMSISGGQKYLTAHNTSSITKDHNTQGLDKLLYDHGTADNVTMTNSKLQNNEYRVITGEMDYSPQTIPKQTVSPRNT